MSYRFATFMILSVAFGGCGLEAPASSEPLVHGTALSDSDGVRLSYRSQRKGRSQNRERTLAIWALQTFCGHNRDFACADGGIVDVEIVSNSNVRCAVIAAGQKHRVANPKERTNAVAEFDCFTNGNTMKYREEFYPIGTAGVMMDGPFAPRPRDLGNTTPVIVDAANPASLKSAESSAELADPDPN